MAGNAAIQRIHTYCGLCIARCGAIATVEDGRFTRLDPDPITRPARRSAPRAAPRRSWSTPGAADPAAAPHPAEGRSRSRLGADQLGRGARSDRRGDAPAGRAARAAGVAFTVSSPSTTAIGDSSGFIQRLAQRLRHAELADHAGPVRLGARLRDALHLWRRQRRHRCGGGAMPDIANSGCLILWGYNPSYTRLTHATATVEALKRGMRLIVVDPRHVGLASKADLWLRVRPGHRRRAGPRHRQRDDRARLVRPRFHPRVEQRAASRARRYRPAADRDAILRRRRARRLFAWDSAAARLVAYDTATGRYDGEHARASRSTANTASHTPDGEVVCHPAFELYAAAVPALPAGDRRGDLLDPARAGRGGGAADLARAAGVLLRLERPRAARQRHPDRARDVAALRADRQLRPARRQRAVPGAAGRADHRRGPARGRRHGADARARRAAARAGALEIRIGARSLPRDPRGPTLSGARRWSASAPTCCWRMPTARRARGAEAARFLRAARPVHEPDRRDGRHRAAGRLGLRARRR